MLRHERKIKMFLQPIFYKIRVILGGPRILPKLGLLFLMIGIYLAFFGGAYYVTEYFVRVPDQKKVVLEESLVWALKHLIDPGFIEDDMKEGDLLVIILGVISIIFGLLCFMVIFLTTVHDLGAHMIRKVAHGVLPPHLTGHLIIVGDSSRIIAFFENKSVIKDLKAQSEAAEVVFVLTDEGSLKRLSEYEIDGCYLFEITESDLRMGHSELQAKYAHHVLLLETERTDFGLRLRFIDQILEERKSAEVSRRSTNLTLTVESSSEDAEELLYTLMNSKELEDAAVSLEYINRFKLSARSILLGLPMTQITYERPDEFVAPHLILDGWSKLSEELIKQVRSFGLYHPEHKTRISFVYRDIANRERFHQKITQWLGDQPVDDYQSVLKVNEIKLVSEDDLSSPSECTTVCAIIICGDDDNRNIAQAQRWMRHDLIKEKGIKLIAEVSDDSPYRFEKYTSSRLLFNLTPSRVELTREIIELDSIPRSTHEAYLAQTEADGKLKRDMYGEVIKLTHRPWNLLSQEVKGWNRSTADHLSIKLYYLAHKLSFPAPVVDIRGDFIELSEEFYNYLDKLIRAYDSAKKESLMVQKIEGRTHVSLDWKHYRELQRNSKQLTTLEILSQWEHDRWSSERYICGWRRGDRGMRRHPNLIPYTDLDEETMAYDRENIIEQLRFRLKAYLIRKDSIT